MPSVGGSFAGRAGANPYLYKTPMYQKFNGGLNVQEFGHLLRDDQLSIATNIVFNAELGSAQIRNGYGNFGLAYNGSSAPSGYFAATFVSGGALVTHLILTTVGTIERSTGTGVAWADITGGLTVNQGRVYFGMMNNVVIGSDGVNAPFAVPSAGAAALLAGSPPTAPLGFEWNGYYFFTRAAAAPNRLYYSALGDHTSWPAANFIDIPAPTDGDAIMGYGFTHGNLIIYKRRSIYIVTGRVASDFQVNKLHASIGMMTLQAAVSVGNASWFVSDRGLYELDGVTIREVSKWVESRYKTIAQSHAISTSTGKPVGIHNYRSAGQVWVAVDFNNDGVYDRIMVHDYTSLDEEGQPAVSEFTYTSPAVAPYFFGAVLSGSDYGSGEEIILGARGTARIFREDNGTTDDSSVSATAITATLKHKHLDLGDAAAVKTPRFVRSIVRNITATDDFSIYTTDNTITSETTTTASAPTANTRFVVPAGAITARGRYVAFGVTMNGNSGTIKTLLGYQLEFLLTGRRT